jgi:hypothetical protein
VITALLILIVLLLAAILWCAAQAVRGQREQAQYLSQLIELGSIRKLAETLLPGPVTTGYPVTVNTKRPDDQTLHGVLVREHPDRLELEDAVWVQPHERTPIPGTVRISKGNISWRQDHHESEATVASDR